MQLKKKTSLQKKLLKKSSYESSETTKTVITSTPLFYEFQKQIENEGETHTIFKFWNDLFKESLPKQDWYLIRLKIEYRLIKLDYEKQKLDLPPSLQKNYEASQTFNVSGLSKNLQNLYQCSKSAEVRKQITMGIRTSTQEKVHETFFRLFSTNLKNRLTNEQLAEEMCKTHPDKKRYTVKDILEIRSLYNRGKLPIQKNIKPMMPSMEYTGKE